MLGLRFDNRPPTNDHRKGDFFFAKAFGIVAPISVQDLISH
jgi:hypothetical protein